jgi:serine phosphatase RsbU (regulator of sigma subunit)
MGFMPSYEYKVGKLKLKPKEKLILYTDGVTEAQNKKGEMFGEERLKKILNKSFDTSKKTIEHIRQEIRRFVNGAEQSDDITMLVIKFKQNKQYIK